jgi:mono/diheme cytochrome c family protein
MKRSIVAFAIVAIVVAIGETVLRTDFRGFSTRSAPTSPERLIARTARQWAVPRAMRDTPNPVSFSDDVFAESRAHFADHCAGCHANDGSGNTEVGRNLYPRAPDMRLAETQRLTDDELYWIIENGVRLTGMPAWGDGTAHDLATWKLVHFVRHLRALTPEQIDEMRSLNPRSPAELREEQEDQDFLNGKVVDSPPDQPHHHH